MAIVPSIQTTETAAGRNAYAIMVAPLASQFNLFCAVSGIYLASDAQQLTKGKYSPAINGIYTLDEGFSRLLTMQGLQAERQTNGSYTLKNIPEGG